MYLLTVCLCKNVYPDPLFFHSDYLVFCYSVVEVL